MLTVYIKTSVFQAMKLQNTALEPAAILTARNNKVGCYENHERQVNLMNKLQPSTLLIADSIWTAENLPIPSSVKFIVIHCGVNNLDYDEPNIIAKGILCIAKTG